MLSTLSNRCDRCLKTGENDSKINYGNCKHKPLCLTCVDIVHGDLKCKVCPECNKAIQDTIIYASGALKIGENSNNRSCIVCSKSIEIGETFQVCQSNNEPVKKCCICLQCIVDYSYNNILAKFCSCNEDSENGTPFCLTDYHEKKMIKEDKENQNELVNLEQHLDEEESESLNNVSNHPILIPVIKPAQGVITDELKSYSSFEKKELKKIILSNDTLIDQLLEENSRLTQMMGDKENKESESFFLRKESDLRLSDKSSSIVFDDISSIHSSNHNKKRLRRRSLSSESNKSRGVVKRGLKRRRSSSSGSIELRSAGERRLRRRISLSSASNGLRSADEGKLRRRTSLSSESDELRNVGERRVKRRILSPPDSNQNKKNTQKPSSTSNNCIYPEGVNLFWCDPEKLQYFFNLSKERPTDYSTPALSPTVQISESEDASSSFIFSRLRKNPTITPSVKQNDRQKKRIKRTFSFKKE